MLFTISVGEAGPQCLSFSSQTNISAHRLESFVSAGPLGGARSTPGPHDVRGQILSCIKQPQKSLAAHARGRFTSPISRGDLLVPGALIQSPDRLLLSLFWFWRLAIKVALVIAYDSDQPGD